MDEHTVYSDDNKPQAYVDGEIYFCGYKFMITPDVLIPRPETEQLVTEVIDFISSNPLSGEAINILEVGTGSGCISVSIAKKVPTAKLIATDISEKALTVASRNAKLLNVEKQISFYQGNLLEHISDKTFDVIVCNLPYVPTDRIPTLDSSVKDFEPHIALDGGEDGFELYRKLFSQVIENRIDFKLLLCEIDDTHHNIASNEARACFSDYDVRILQDFSQFDRLLRIEKKGPNQGSYKLR